MKWDSGNNNDLWAIDHGNISRIVMSKKIAVVQSNYIPWKGYFDLIPAVDEFILCDGMQYTRRDWCNRNKIKMANGVKCISVPVKVKGKYHQLIRETAIDGVDWAQSHRGQIKQSYFKKHLTNQCNLLKREAYLCKLRYSSRLPIKTFYNILLL